MLIARYKTLVHSIKSNEHDLTRVKQVFWFIILLLLVILFIMRILDTVNKGIAAQKRTEKIAQEVKELEQKNEDLQYQKELFNSESQIEAEYRALENKKKAGEKVYIIDLPKKNNDSNSEENSVSQTVNSNKATEPNWKQWLSALFK